MTAFQCYSPSRPTLLPIESAILQILADARGFYRVRGLSVRDARRRLESAFAVTIPTVAVRRTLASMRRDGWVDRTRFGGYRRAA